MNKNKNLERIAKKVLDLEIKALKKLRGSINSTFASAVDLIARCKSKVIISKFQIMKKK